MRTLPTRTFFYRMEPGDEFSVETGPGKALEMRLLTLGKTNEKGEMRVSLELNCQPRQVRLSNRKVTGEQAARHKADPANPCHVAAPMPGVVASVAVTAGAMGSEANMLMTIEAMKMKTGLHADRDGAITAQPVGPGQQIDAKDRLVKIE